MRIHSRFCGLHCGSSSIGSRYPLHKRFVSNVLALVFIEKAIRDAKVQVLNSIPPIELEDCVLGQYEGYADDPTIENKDTTTPTFAAIRLKINNPRWAGVPIILKAGKALDERKAEMRLQLRDAPAAQYLFGGHECPRNEIVFRLQPDEAIY